MVGLFAAIIFATPAPLLVVTEDGGKTRVLDLESDGKERAVLYERPAAEIESLAIDRSGRRIVIRQKSNAPLILFDIATKQSTKLPGTGGARPAGFFKGRAALLIFRMIDPDVARRFAI